MLAFYLVSRVVSLVAVWVAATYFQNPAGVGHASPGLGDMFGLWDGVWYERIVRDGYPVPLPVDADSGKVTYSAWAFYPLYPYLVKGVMLTGMPFAVAGLVLNLVLAGVAAVLIWAVLRSGVHADRQPQRERLALVAACLWCFYPTTAVMLKPYTEALAVALVAGAVLLLIRRSYLLVALVALPLGFTRGIAPALGAAALIHLVVRWREDRAAGARPLHGQRASAAVMLAALAVSAVAWPVVAGLATGVPTAFFDVQAAWGQRPDKGPFVLWFEWAWQGKGIAGVVVLVALAGTYVALVLGRPRPVDLHRGAGVGARLPALPLRGGAPDHQHVALPAPGLPPGGAPGVGRDAHRQRPGRGAALAAPGRGGARRPRRRAVLVDLLVARLHAVGVVPALTCEEPAWRISLCRTATG